MTWLTFWVGASVGFLLGMLAAAIIRGVDEDGR